MSERIDSRLAVDALEMAVSRQLPEAGLIAHSDRGVQYASEHYQRTLTTHGIECSMSRRGDCWHNAEPNAEWVIAKHRPLSVRNGDGWRGANLRTMLHKIIRRAGCKPWPRAWNNLRASRATELAEEFPGHVAAAWLGHTEEIADAHYRQVLPGHFERAIIATTSKSETVHQTVHDAVQSTVQETVPRGVAVHRTELQTPHNHLTPCDLAQEKAVACENMRPPILEAGGH